MTCSRRKKAEKLAKQLHEIDEVEETIQRLEKQIRRDGWMANVEDCLREDLDRMKLTELVNNDVSIDSILDELLTRFEESWEETAHFECFYFNSIYEALKEKYPEWDNELLFGETSEILSERVWPAFHEEHDTFKIAERLVDKKLSSGGE